MNKDIIKFKLGDIVQLSKKWKNKIGFVIADDKSWWVIKNHYDIANCMCTAKDVVKVIKSDAIAKKYLKYI